MLEARNITVSVGDQKLLDDVFIQFCAGKVSAILGPNGAGKSTLLACLAGLQQPESGGAMMDGQGVGDMDGRARARQIGLLPQSANVHWDILARDLVALGRYPYLGLSGKAEDDALIDAAMAATATSDFAARNVLGLSGGERARVLLARVLAGEPKWLLADEPLANLDPRYQLQLLEQLRTLAGKGTGVVTVLHDLTQAARFADNVILMQEGSIFASGTVEAVMTAENIGQVFDIRCAILYDDDGRIVIVPNGQGGLEIT